MKYQIGKKIKQLRENIGLNQKEFSEKIGVSNSRVSNWEKGINRPDVDLLYQICKVLKVSADELLELNNDVSLNAQEQNLITQYKKLTPNGKILLSESLNSILKYETNQLNGSAYVKESSAAYAENITVLPTLVQRICAGTGSIGDDVLYEEGQYPAISVPDGSQYAAVITGNSMEPDFSDGDIVFYKKVDSLNYGDIGIFNLNDENIIKKYEKTGLHAINPEYDDVIPASDDHVVIIGKVLGKM